MKVFFVWPWTGVRKARNVSTKKRSLKEEAGRPIRATLTFGTFNFDRIPLLSSCTRSSWILYSVKIASYHRPSITIRSTRPPHVYNAHRSVEVSTLSREDNPRISEFSIIVRYYPPRLWVGDYGVKKVDDKFRGEKRGWLLFSAVIV